MFTMTYDEKEASEMAKEFTSFCVKDLNFVGDRDGDLTISSIEGVIFDNIFKFLTNRGAWKNGIGT